MRVIALVSQKGGAGKTTIATNVAVFAERQGLSTVVFDLDPQASAATWRDARGDDPPDVVAAQAPRLAKMLEAARRQGAALAIVDTAPNADTAALEAAKAADLVLIPCRASAFDLGAVGASVRLAAQVAGKPSWVVMNAAPPTSKIAEEAASTLSAAGVNVAPHRLTQRMDYVNPLAAGRAAVEWEPRGKAAAEVGALWGWIRGQLGMTAPQNEVMKAPQHAGVRA
jgi:chromosome partitioning protein